MLKVEVRLQNRVLSHYALEKSPVVIGRDPSCDVAVDNALLSRRHARIVAENGKFYVEDLQSTNGISLRGKKVEREELASGDEIRIDKFSFLVHFPEPEKKPKPLLPDFMGTMQLDAKTLEAKLRDVPPAPPAPAKETPLPAWMVFALGLQVGLVLGFLVARMIG